MFFPFFMFCCPRSESLTRAPACGIIPPMSKDREILSLRYRGYDNEDISEMMEISTDAVEKAVLRVARASVDEDRANIVREAEIEKLEAMETAIYEAAVQPLFKDDNGQLHMSKSALSAQTQVLRLMERRTALLGIDKQPAALNATGGLTLVQILANMPQPTLDDRPSGRHLNGSIEQLTPRDTPTLSGLIEGDAIEQY